MTGALHRLRLINTRNRLTHAMMEAVLASQASYLRSGDILALRPLTQAAVSAWLRSKSNLSVVADPGRISRLVRRLSIALPNGKVVPLGTLFPKPRQVYCHFVKHEIRKETILLAQGFTAKPLTDEAIADLLDHEHGICLSRRTVADIRRSLAIPDWRSRRQRMNYLAATEGFSALVPLTPQALRTAVPTHAGVYEIRSVSAFPLGGQDGAGERASPVPHGVVYIGSSGDMRKRLGEHLRGNSGNDCLSCHIDKGTARVRFRLVSDDWRRMERELYRVFCETFGAPTPCNRMSP
jgi:RNA polymerase sigma-54 factor